MIKELKSTDIVYESKNGTNVIIADGEYYIISHKNGKCACFDYNKTFLNHVIHAIEKDGNFQVTDSANGFYIVDDNGNFKYNLSQLILSTAYNKSLSEIKKGKINYLDGNKLNCCLDNLDSTRIVNTKTTPYTITHNDKCIFLNYKANSSIATMSYSAELLNIVKKFRWNYISQYNVFQTVVYKKSNEHITVSLHQLAYTYYNYPNITERNILHKIEQLKKNFKKYNLEIDHLDSNRCNDCKYNLSAMAKDENVRKSDITARIIYPYFHVAVYIDMKYKVAIGKVFDNDVNIQAYECKDAKEYITLLTDFYKRGLFPNGALVFPTPKDNYKAIKKSAHKCSCQEIPQIDEEKLLDDLLKADNLLPYTDANIEVVA